MTSEAARERVPIASDALAVLMPLYLRLDADGIILAVGPTLAKIDDNLVGQDFLDRFDVIRPRGIVRVQELRAALARAVHIRVRSPRGPNVGLRCVAMPVGDDESGLLVNCSFGMQVADAVVAYDLTHHDFAPTDLAVEMLYLVEGRKAAEKEARQLIARLEQSRIEAEKRSLTDELTGLANRRAFDREVIKLVDSGQPFAVLAIDLDHFKAVNDQYGHTVGDAVLRVAAQRLRTCLRESDFVARIGGDEFLAILRDVGDASLPVTVGERLVERLKEPIMVEGVTCHIAASVGIANEAGLTQEAAQTLMARADEALYRSKRSGRGLVTVSAD
ncbi:diguanylate cyclase [Alphaproteobacteria bacterium GH1-50]|uniref:Diguanylate cyclase n=1 Tax=Kangsaoukella pontilimi TaxID=2691042 RepID=A0A7C9IE10_9RHOB|nr:GGDEF domain-containing protein [Kangsaoukella pontilimi]MXQ06384.1 diguanylate cyclase [Kangsaoukella pontilimi]